MKLTKHESVCIIGLGYVGLPLLIEFSKKRFVYGIDNSKNRVRSLKEFIDSNNEVSKRDLKSLRDNYMISNSLRDIGICRIYIITLPTPVNSKNLPDLKSIYQALQDLIKYKLKKGDTIIFESTFYPGLIDEKLIPFIEKKSKLKKNIGFFIGYSPERINPGDKNRTLTKIIKIVSGSNGVTLKFLKDLYGEIISAGIHAVSSIKVAEAAKVIENTQRDINIGLVNEFSKILHSMKLNSSEVLDAASTKWNFHKFYPGLVGGHCISIDPYYLAYKAKKNKINPKVILSARETNDKMYDYVIKKTLEIVKLKKINIKNSKVIFFGVSFKENCPDLRNSQVIRMMKVLKQKSKNIYYFDNLASNDEILAQNFKKLSSKEVLNNKFDIVFLSVLHSFGKKQILKNLNKIKSKNSIVVDLKNYLPSDEVNFQL